MMKQKCILVITDGIGHNESEYFNAFSAAKKPTYEHLFKTLPHTLIKTSGLAVGLPEGQMGNSEVGHMCIGSGRILYQNLVKINQAIEQGALAQNANLKAFLKSIKRVHIIGLYSDGGVHAMHTHFNALLEIAKNAGKEVFAHAITDGRDVSPTSGLGFIKELESLCERLGVHLASLCGRFFAMDRDKRWERVREFYNALLGKAPSVAKFSEYIAQNYAQNVTDEFLPACNAPDFTGLGVDDGIIFINFRNDRMKEIVSALSDDEFSEFERPFVFKNILTMSVYDEKFNLPVLFDKEELTNTLAAVISEHDLSQLHTAETEKYAHVTFFFNGGKEDLVAGESRVLIPSPKVKTYDEKPEMSAYEVLEAVKKGIEKGEDFIVVNFANGDMVGHTGDFEACVKAVEAVDTCLGELIKAADAKDYAYIITSDHGNCEALRDKEGKPLTNHTTFDVYAFVKARGVSELKKGMGLSNIAASVLKILGIPKPAEMNEALF